MGRLIEGRNVAHNITARNIGRVAKLKEKGIVPTLAIVRVGSKVSDKSYEKGIFKRATATGVEIRHIILKPDVSQEKLLKELDKLNNDKGIHGILIFRPLPDHIDDRAICEFLNPEKDVDGITMTAMGNVFTKGSVGYPPCTAQACMEMLEYIDYDLTSKKVTVLGRSLVIGKPVAIMALDQNATVTIVHSRTKKEDKINACKNADVVIAAIGKPKIVTADMLGENQVLIDVGINVDEHGDLCGDFDFDNVSASSYAITPVPGGVGGVTTSVLMNHVIKAAMLQNGIEIIHELHK